MGYRSDAGRCHVNPARVSLCLSDEIWHRLGGKGRMDLHDMGRAEHAGHWRNIPEVIETETSVERRVDRVRRTIEEHRVSVRGRLHDDLGAEIAPGASPILDHEWLPQTLRQPLTHQARDDVAHAAGGKGNDETNRPRRK